MRQEGKPHGKNPLSKEDGVEELESMLWRVFSPLFMWSSRWNTSYKQGVAHLLAFVFIRWLFKILNWFDVPDIIKNLYIVFLKDTYALSKFLFHAYILPMIGFLAIRAYHFTFLGFPIFGIQGLLHECWILLLRLVLLAFMLVTAASLSSHFCCKCMCIWSLESTHLNNIILLVSEKSYKFI